MEKTRVNKGEVYWYIYLGSRNVVATKKVDYYNSTDDNYFRNDNYFHTKEEAEAMAEKIRKVLKGADVIEMPSEEDVYNEEFKTNPYLFCEDGAAVVGAHQTGFNHCFEWLKSKIVK